MARVFPNGKEIFLRQGQGDLSKLARACEQHAKKRMTRANDAGLNTLGTRLDKSME